MRTMRKERGLLIVLSGPSGVGKEQCEKLFFRRPVQIMNILFQ